MVGDMIGVSRFAISKYETGDRRPDTDSLRKLAHLYNTTIDAIVNEDMTGVFTKEDMSDAT
jgi:transcriptional regulator with XRE-family HTH domain